MTTIPVFKHNKSGMPPTRLAHTGKDKTMNTFAMSQGAGQKLEFAFQRNDGTTSDLDWLSTGENLKSVIMLARGEAELVVKAKPAPIPESEPVIDPVIRVDRSVKPIYPDWVKEVLHPELENIGPAEYDASSIDQWLHDDQKNGNWTTGNNVYAKLKEKDCKLLKTCLGLRDLEEIQKKGITFFRKHFKGKAVLGWASVGENRDGNLFVPYLCEFGDEVVLRWSWLGIDWDDFGLALRHAS